MRQNTYEAYCEVKDTQQDLESLVDLAIEDGMLLAYAFLLSLGFPWREATCLGRVLGRAHAALKAFYVLTMDVWVASLIN